MVELRKRKAPAAEPIATPPLKKSNSSTSKAKGKVPEKKAATLNGSSSTVTKIAVGVVINLDGFGGEIETHTGEKTTLKKLVDDSKSGVVLFTYPKASTPGCTTQACLFRDDFTSLTATGYSIFGLSTDSPKSNTTFKTKQNLPYTLLCDPSATLIAAIGLKKAPKGTTRGVVVVNKQAKVELVFAGGPGATVDEVRKLMSGSADEGSEDMRNVAEGEKVGTKSEEGETRLQESDEPKQSDLSVEANDDEPPAEVAAEVADSAEKLDREK